MAPGCTGAYSIITKYIIINDFIIEEGEFDVDNDTLYLYPKFLSSLMNKEVDLDGGRLKVMLVGTGYVYSSEHKYLSSVSGEVTGYGYTQGGAIINNPTFTISGNIGRLTGDNASWGNLMVDNVKGYIIYDDSSSSANSKPLIAYMSFKEPIDFDYSKLEIVWSADGIIKIAF